MSSAHPIIARTEPLDDGLYVVVSGDVDLSRSPELRTALLQIVQDQPRRIVLDLEDVGYMDSSGVATLVEALQRQRKHGGQLVLCSLQPKVRSIFEISRLDSVFQIVDDAQQARSA